MNSNILNSMASFQFFQVDAFTDVALRGNPCAIVLDADSLKSDQMQAIAREQNLSETAFILQSDQADVRARYFTPFQEIPLAGHPTIASIHILVESGRIQLTEPKTTISLELEAGIVSVDVLTSPGNPTEIVMTQLKPQFLSIVPPDQATSAFGLSSTDLIPEKPVQVVSTGTPQLMLPVRDVNILDKIQVNIASLKQLSSDFQFFSAHLFSVSNTESFARHFATPPDVFEDPFTGSATGGMGAYLWHYNLISQPTFVAHQGAWIKRPGQGRVTILGPRNNISAVQVGGRAITVITGTLYI